MTRTVKQSRFDVSERVLNAFDLLRKQAGLALTLARVQRATMHEDGERYETDADHILMLALLACELNHELRLGMRHDRVLQFAVCHELTETYLGDIVTLNATPEVLAHKKKLEESAAAFVARDWPYWRILHEQYEMQCSDEARFVRLVDKLLPKLTHIMNKGAAVRRLISHEEHSAHNKAQLERLRVTGGRWRCWR